MYFTVLNASYNVQMFQLTILRPHKVTYLNVLNISNSSLKSSLKYHVHINIITPQSRIIKAYTSSNLVLIQTTWLLYWSSERMFVIFQSVWGGRDRYWGHTGGNGGPNRGTHTLPNLRCVYNNTPYVPSNIATDVNPGDGVYTSPHIWGRVACTNIPPLFKKIFFKE